MMFCDVLALRKMQQDKAAANPPKKNNMKKTATKWMGTSRITTKKRCSRIIQSVRKFLLTTNADNCFKLLSKFRDCKLQVLTLFVAQISTPMLLYCALHWFCSIPSETTGWLQIDHEKIRSVMLPHVTEPWKPLTSYHCKLNLHVFLEKKNVRTKSIKNPYYKLLFRFFLISLAYKSRPLWFASAQRHRGL